MIVTPRPYRLLHIASHVSIQHDPDKHRTVDLLDFLEDIGVGNIDFNAEVLLFVDEDRLGEAERRKGRWLTVANHIRGKRIRTRAAGEKPRRHFNHDLLADKQSRNGVEDQLADDVTSAVVRPDLLERWCFFVQTVNHVLDIANRK